LCARQNVFKSRFDFVCFFSRQHARRHKRGAVRDAAMNVSFEEPPIERERLVEPRESCIGFPSESTTPQVFGFRLGHLSAGYSNIAEDRYPVRLTNSA
jgi:hypothetical protein